MVDIFSKKAWTIPLKTKHATEIVKALMKVVAEAGTTPTILQSDNGAEFKNETLDRCLQQVEIKAIHLLAYTPTSQGAI